MFFLCLNFLLLAMPLNGKLSDANNIIQSTVSYFNPLSANITKWSNTIKQFVSNLTSNCLSVFDQFVGLALKGLSNC